MEAESCVSYYMEKRNKYSSLGRGKESRNLYDAWTGSEYLNARSKTSVSKP